MDKNCIWQTESLHGDEYYTLESTAEQIANQLVTYKLCVWLPFNDTDSVWGDVLARHGYKSIATEGDFFLTDPPKETNCIISNPPFSIKKQVLERTRQLGLPFAYILPFTWLNDTIPMEYGHQIMLFRKRMHFNTVGGGLK